MKTFIITLIFSIFSLFSVNEISNHSVIMDKNNTQKYIDKYAHLAVEEMYEYRIPASVTMSQAILESASGESELAINANNHFGIKCKPEWKGMTYYYNDDDVNECFRKYDSVEHSFQDHSLFLANRLRYAFLFTYRHDDYRSWCKGLQKAGYATGANYGDKLIYIIEYYKLDSLDNL